MPIGINSPTFVQALSNVPGKTVIDKIGNFAFDAFTGLKNVVGSASGKNYVDNLYSGDLDYKRAIEQAEAHRQFSASEAQKLRDWQEYMSNTAYSRAVKDLKSVGINPYAIGGFNAASTPSGAYGQSSVAGGYGNLMSNSTGALTSIASSAISAIALIATKGKLKF